MNYLGLNSYSQVRINITNNCLSPTFPARTYSILGSRSFSWSITPTNPFNPVKKSALGFRVEGESSGGGASQNPGIGFPSLQ
jgi:hypothetical protein